MKTIITITAVIGITLLALALMMFISIFLGKILKRRRIDQETTFDHISKHIK